MVIRMQEEKMKNCDVWAAAHGCGDTAMNTGSQLLTLIIWGMQCSSLELPGIDPGTSRMLSARSTI